jgi:hypothetical protein
MAIVGSSVTGKTAPETLKPTPVRLSALTVTAELPVEVRVTGSVTGVPTGSSPKFKDVVLRESTGLEVVPVPVRLTVAVLPVDELLETVMVPLAAPATVGTKLT